jgi:hypothetical protein
MRRFVVIALMLLAAAAVAQEKPDNKPAENKPAARNDFAYARSPYRLDFTIKELEDGKVVNTRSYSMVIQSAEERNRSYGEVKTGSRVPVTTTESKTGEKQFQYIDVGVSIMSRLYQMEAGNLLLDSNIEISSLALPDKEAQPGLNYAGAQPIIRQVRSNITGEITAGKPNQIASLDDPISRHRFQIEVTATKLR